MTARWEPPDLDDLINDYLAGSTPKEIGRKHGISERPIVRVLRENRVKLRSRSEAEALKWRRRRSRPDYREQVTRQCGAAWKAAKGRIHSDAEVQARASSLYRNGTRRGRGTLHEDRLASCLLRLGLKTKKQFPVNRYNVDLAVPELRFAVEVVSHGINPQYAPTFTKRVEHLLDHGWFVLIIEVIKGPDRRSVEIPLIAEKVVAVAKNVSCGEPSWGKYGVIDRQGGSSAAFRRYLDHLPRIERP